MGTYFLRETMSIRLVHRFFDMDPFLTSFAPFESARRPLSNVAKIVQNESVDREIRTNRNIVDKNTHNRVV